MSGTPGRSLEMNDRARDALVELVRTRGRELCDDPRRLRGLLTDYCPGMKREVNLIVMAAENRLVSDLLGASTSIPWSSLSGRLVSRMVDEMGISESSARWVVDAWGHALGTDSPPPTERATTRR